MMNKMEARILFTMKCKGIMMLKIAKEDKHDGDKVNLIPLLSLLQPDFLNQAHTGCS